MQNTVLAGCKSPWCFYNTPERSLYSRINKSLIFRHKPQINFPLTAEILLPTPSISKGRHRLSSSMEPRSPSAVMTFTPLQSHEIPTKERMLIALDAEFVTLNAVRSCYLLTSQLFVIFMGLPLEGTRIVFYLGSSMFIVSFFFVFFC